MHQKVKIHIHANNIHIGGGLEVLKAILEEKEFEIESGSFDQRICSKIFIDSKIDAEFIKPNLIHRLLSEIKLCFFKKQDVEIVCLNSLPPLFTRNKNVTVIVQNRLLFDKKYIHLFPVKTRLRLFLESMWIKIFHSKNYKYIVPTKSMKDLIQDVLGRNTITNVIPFILKYKKIDSNNKNKKFQFLYVASGEAHKNHANLLKAWAILSEKNVRPHLALTINESIYKDLSKMIDEYKNKYDLKITNLGNVDHVKISQLYSNSEALIFPSLVESYGLPLIEAQYYGLPIFASDMQYVKDVSKPQITFDPESPQSIAKSIVENKNLPSKMTSIPKEFFTQLLYKELSK